MRDLLKKEYRVPARWLLVAIFIFLIIFIIYKEYDYSKKPEEVIFAILSGLAAGLVVALIQFLLTWREQKQIDKFENMGVIEILPARDDRKVYGNIIQNTRERLWVMGNTATRLLDHFAVEGNTTNKDEKAICNILEKGVDVKILVAEKRKLVREEDKERFDRTKNRLVELKKKYPKNFDYRYYNHTPNHSIFIFDDQCFLGSTFDNLPSKETPVIRMKTNSEFAIKYIHAFKYEWDKAKEVEA